MVDQLLIFSDKCEFKASLDAEMKRIRDLGIGVRKKQKQAEIITRTEEEILWERPSRRQKSSGIETIIGLYFAL